MATSGSVDFNLSRNDIVKEALQLLNVVGSTDTPDVSDQNFAISRLNAMLKAWQGEGLHLWSKQEGVLFLEYNKSEYDLSSASGSAKVCKAGDAVITQLGADGSTSDTSITVDSTADMAANDNIGIVLDAGTIHWTTISSVDSSTTLTIASGLASAAATDNNVYTFTSRADRPLRILSCRRVEGIGTTQVEHQLLKMSHEEYFDLANKNQQGEPNMFYYDPQLTTGKLYLHQTPTDMSQYIRFTYERSLEDFDAATDNADLPQEWLDTLVYNLAVRLAPAYGLAHGENFKAIVGIAATTKRTAEAFDREITSLRITLDDE